jgi:tRNA-modifying protein YgfZ
MHYVSPDHSIITFDGINAQAFLQSQLTNDVAALGVGEWQWQGYCNAKGRLHATFALVRTGETMFHAVNHTSTTAFLVKRLTMFRLRSKLTINVDETLAAIHHLIEPAERPHALATLALGNGRWVSIEPRSANDSLLPTPESMGRWNIIGIESKQPEIVSETNEIFVPQMIGFDTVQPKGGVSFSKGCYPGQEVVARAHYRGAVKRRLAVAEVPIDAVPGATVTSPDGQEVDVVNVARQSAASVSVALVVEPIPAG